MRKWTILISVLTMVFLFSGLSNADLNDGLLAYYPFNGNANDETGAYPGNPIDVSWTNDRFGNPNSAAYFNGSSSYIDTIPPGDIPSSITFTAWINPTKNIYCHLWGSIYSTYGGKDGYVAGYSDGQIYFSYYKNNTIIREDSISTSIGSAPLNQWSHIAYVLDSQNESEIYINGELKASGGGFRLVSDSHDRTLMIGLASFIGDVQYNFGGLIDEVHIYNRALSENEILALYTPPGANAGPDKIICNQICDQVVLDGRKSYDLNGQIISYEWKLDHEDNFCDQSTTGETPTSTGLCPGAYDVTLTVTDDDGLTGTDEMVLTVLETCDPCSIMQGDFDSDGDVDGDDLKVFSGQFGTEPLTP